MKAPVSSDGVSHSSDIVRPAGQRWGWKYTDEAYNRRWLARVMKSVLFDAAGCWIWQGNCTPTGYGSTSYRGDGNGVHRLMYQVHFGVKLETDQYVLHRCDVRGCCNPGHLFLGSAKDNNNDCATKGRHYEGGRDFCEQGHPLTGDNVRIGKQSKPQGGIKRGCIACDKIRMKTPKYIQWRRDYQRRRRAEKRAAAQAESR